MKNYFQNYLSYLSYLINKHESKLVNDKLLNNNHQSIKDLIPNVHDLNEVKMWTTILLDETFRNKTVGDHWNEQHLSA